MQQDNGGHNGRRMGRAVSSSLSPSPSIPAPLDLSPLPQLKTPTEDRQNVTCQSLISTRPCLHPFLPRPSTCDSRHGGSCAGLGGPLSPCGGPLSPHACIGAVLRELSFYSFHEKLAARFPLSPLLRSARGRGSSHRTPTPPHACALARARAHS